MAGLVQGAWIQTKTTLSGMRVWISNISFDATNNDAYTLKTPNQLDTSKQWDLLISAAAAVDAQAVPVDLWGGYSDNFAVTGDGASVAATSGFKVKQILDDCVLAVTPLVYQITFDPILPVADVVTVAAIGSGLKVRIPILPYYAIDLNGGSTLNVTNCNFYIIQKDKQ